MGESSSCAYTWCRDERVSMGNGTIDGYFHDFNTKATRKLFDGERGID